MGPFEYDILHNGSPTTVPELNDLPIKVAGPSTIYIRDVAEVSAGFSPQTNIVRQDGRRGVLISIVKAGEASTLDVVNGVRNMLPRIAATLPPELKIQPLADQSVFVKAAVSGVIREAVIAACLTAAMILLFLGSWRSTLIIAVSIPLSILTSIVVLSLLGETINIMTLGGLASRSASWWMMPPSRSRTWDVIWRKDRACTTAFWKVPHRLPFPHWCRRSPSASSSYRCSS
jgi:multidrug efflux pump subunit AcrB